VAEGSTTDDPRSPDADTAAGRRGRSRVDAPRALTLALGVAGGLVLAQLVTATAARLRDLLLLVLLSLFLSFAMEPAVQWMHQRGVRRGIGTGITFVAVALLGVGLAASMYDLVVDQVSNLVEASPQLLRDLAARADELPEPLQEPIADFLDAQSEELPSRVSGAAALLGRQAVGLGSTVVGTVVSGLAVLLITFYLVADGPRLRWQLSRRLGPARQRELLEVWELAIAKTGGYVYSRLLLAIVSTAVHIVAFLAVLVGAALLGPVGALLALPAAAIVAALVTSYAEEHEVLEHGLTTTPPPRPSRPRRGDDGPSTTT
jgi:predicted PurR-regulated permease PerM